jgi:thioredoxin reductase (NADPH)
MEQMKAQSEHVGTKVIADAIVEVDFSRRPFRLVGDSGDVYVGETVIICTGAQARWLGIPGEDAFRGRGVSACATCDGFFYRDKTVAMIGGGNAAVTDALLLAKFARQVTLLGEHHSEIALTAAE